VAKDREEIAVLAALAPPSMRPKSGFDRLDELA